MSAPMRLLATLALLCAGLRPCAADEPVSFVTNLAFRKALEEPVSGTWGGNDVNLRTILRAIAEARQVAVLPDRRIDPTANRQATSAGEPLGEFLERVAAGSNAGAAVVGNTVYLGPPASTAKLRTLVALRSLELFDKSTIPDGRRIDLTRGNTFRWDDLSRPADVLRRLSEQYGVGIEGLELVPHDLWGEAVLPDANAIEALSLVLIQFDLTFGWIDHGKGVRIERVPSRVAIERAHQPPRRMSAEAAVEDWKEKIPGLEARVEKGKVMVSGTEELHELVERIRRGGTIPDKTGPGDGPPRKPLKFERYTLRMKNQPGSALLKELQTPAQGQLTFEYDADEFKAAGINLDKLISLEVKKATIEELLKATFDPLGVTFEIVDRTVKLKPASPK
jgi:hypothetical protein